MVPATAPAEPDAIPLYGKATMGSAANEIWSKSGDVDYTVRNVTRPTLTPVLPDPTKPPSLSNPDAAADGREAVKLVRSFTPIS